MDKNMPVNATTTSLVLAAIALLYLLGRKLGVARYPNEPPYIPSLVPYFGHAFGMFRHKMAYYKIVK